jgi:O-antigen/teichoic acid export membrane protein
VINPLTLRDNVAWSLVANIVYGACSWGIIVLLTKLTSPSTVGQFALALAVSAPVFQFANMELRMAQATDVQSEYSFEDYLGLRTITTSLAILAVALLLLAAPYKTETEWVILAVALVKAADSCGDAFHGLFQQHERMDYIAKSLILRGLLGLLVMAVGVLLTDRLIWGVAGMVLTGSLILATYDIRQGLRIWKGSAASTRACCDGDRGTRRRLRPRFEWRTLKSLTILVLPLGCVSMLLALQGSIPRYMIEYYLGSAHLGVFAAVACLIVPGQMVAAAVGQAAMPRLSHYYARADLPSFRRLFCLLLALGALMGIAGIVVALLLGRQLLGVIYTEQYAIHAGLLAWMMAGGAISYMGNFMGNSFNATRAFRRYPLPYAIATIVGAFLSWVLIPRYGLLGAAWTMCVVYTLVALLIGYLMNQTGVVTPSHHRHAKSQC